MNETNLVRQITSKVPEDELKKAEEMNLTLLDRMAQLCQNDGSVRMCGQNGKSTRVLVFVEPIDVSSIYEEGDDRRRSKSGKMFLCMTRYGFVGLKIPGISNTGSQIQVEVDKGKRMIETVGNGKLDGGGFSLNQSGNWYLNLDRGGDVQCRLGSYSVEIPIEFAQRFVNNLAMKSLPGKKETVFGNSEQKSAPVSVGLNKELGNPKGDYGKLFDKAKERFGIDKDWENMTPNERYTMIWLNQFADIVPVTLLDDEPQGTCFLEDKLREKYMPSYEGGKSKFEEYLRQTVGSLLETGNLNPGEVAVSLLKDYQEALFAYDTQMSIYSSKGTPISPAGVLKEIRFTDFGVKDKDRADREKRRKILEAAFVAVYTDALLGLRPLADDETEKHGEVDKKKAIECLEKRLRGDELPLTLSSVGRAVFYREMNDEIMTREGEEILREGFNKHVSNDISKATNTNVDVLGELGAMPSF